MSNPTIYLSNHATDDDITVRASNLSPIKTPRNVANHSKAEKIPTKTITMGISNSGATGHFLRSEASCYNFRNRE
jgi:hypothetical protein